MDYKKAWDMLKEEICKTEKNRELLEIMQKYEPIHIRFLVHDLSDEISGWLVLSAKKYGNEWDIDFCGTAFSLHPSRYESKEIACETWKGCIDDEECIMHVEIQPTKEEAIEFAKRVYEHTKNKIQC